MSSARRSTDPDRRPTILCVVDRAGWAHDRKTDALAAALAGEYRIVKRYESELTGADLAGADCVLLYYWLQAERLALLHPLEKIRDRLLLGICSHFELEGSWREPGLAILDALPRATFVINLTLLRELRPLLRRSAFYTPNGVDTEFFRPAPASRAATAPGRLRVGWAGSLTNQGPAQRGVAELIEPAVAAVAGASLQLACREQRWRDAAEMLAFYRELDVYVCASRNEGTPNPCLEASACGVPVVTTRVGNMPEFVQHGETGMLVDRTVEAIAAALATLRDDPALRARMGSAARANCVANWNWRLMAANYDAMFRSVLTEARRG